MNVFVNSEKTEVSELKTLSELLLHLNMQASRGIAVAVNNQVVPRQTWTDFHLNENDKVTIIKATQGG